MRRLLISEVAKAVGVHPETLRRLERKGVISSYRDVNGWRRYGADMIPKLKKLYGNEDQGPNEVA